MELTNCKNTVTRILNHVKKPITYTGNEVNSVHKDKEKEKNPDLIRFGLAFPDLYEIGMSHLGSKILYGLLNSYSDVWCERVYAPDYDMEECMLENGIPLYALESMDPVKNLDFLGFTLQYEMSYTNLLNMLSLAHISLYSKDRSENDPFVIAGGPCAYNPEPLSDFIDFFVIGESEEVLPELLDIYREWKKSGKERLSFLKEAAKLEGIYVPMFYDVEYNGNQTIKSFKPNTSEAKPVVKKRMVSDLEKIYYPKEEVVPYSDTVQDRLGYEILRGCPHSCRFCQAGQIYKPYREKSLQRIERDIDILLSRTGYDEVSLSSLTSGDHSCIQQIITDLVERYENQKVKVALPSLRVDSLSIDMLKEMEKVKKSGSITLAPEAGTQRLRDVINKNVTEEDLLKTVSSAFNEGWGKIKLYFMIGLPTETDQDLEGIAELGEKVVSEYFHTPKDKRNKQIRVSISTSCFVPKPFTAFQWAGQVSREELTRRQDILKSAVRNPKLDFKWSESEMSYLEAVLARGDRRLGKVLKRAWELGCRFDGWNEHFQPEIWKQAFEECGINPDFYALRQRSLDEILPWDFIDIGVSKDYLLFEWEKALASQTSLNCFNGCERCGMLEFEDNRNSNSICFNKTSRPSSGVHEQIEL